MKPSTKSKTSKKLKIGKLYIVVTASIIISTVFALCTNANEMKVLVAERTEIQSQIEAENRRQIDLSSQKHYYESDSYIEEVAREKLGFVKPNDVIFIDRNSK